MKFLCDQMLGTLAIWLRIIGYDTSYVKKDHDDEIIIQSKQENRILLTRDKAIAHTYESAMLINSTNLYDQIQQVVHEFGLTLEDTRVLSLCTLCNVSVEPMEKSTLKNLVPMHAYESHQHFWQCPSCGRIYWKGSHWDNIQRFIGTL